MGSKLNVIIIAIDALRAQNLSCYGYKEQTSPNVDKLAENGVLFKDTYTSITNTDPCFTTLFTGKFPLSHGIMNHGPRVTDEEVARFDKSGIKLLSEILKDNGYRTLAVDWLFRWHKRGYDYYSGVKANVSMHGFLKQQFRKFPWLRKLIGQKFINKIGSKVFKGQTKPYEDAVYVTDKAIKLVKENKDNPFMLFLHYWDTHGPYLPPSKYLKIEEGHQEMKELQELFTNPDFPIIYTKFENLAKTIPGVVEAYYNGEIAFVDDQLSRLFDYLIKNGLLDNSIIIITADHGESLMEHGIYLDHHGLYDEVLHIPLIMLHPDYRDGKSVEGFVQNFDITPTILDVLNINPGYGFDGASFIPLINNQKVHDAIYAEEAQWQRKRAIRNSEWKYITALSNEGNYCQRCGLEHGPMQELYNVQQDPTETNNLASQHPEVTQKLKDQLDIWVAKFEYEELSQDTKEKKYTEDQKKIEERLKNLGYF